MAFSALRMRLLASLSNCWEANLEFLESWTLFSLSLAQDSGTDLFTRMFWILLWLSSSLDFPLSCSQMLSMLMEIFYKIFDSRDPEHSK